MGRASSLIVIGLIGAIPDLVRLAASLLMIWLTLGWKVGRARKAFEEELRKQGMPKQDAKRLGARYAALKNEAMNAFKRSIRFSA